jgi:hypothetical protein
MSCTVSCLIHHLNYLYKAGWINYSCSSNFRSTDNSLLVLNTFSSSLLPRISLEGT